MVFVRERGKEKLPVKQNEKKKNVVFVTLLIFKKTISMTTIDAALALAAERAVGIEEYASACEGFDAVLKHR